MTLQTFFPNLPKNLNEPRLETYSFDAGGASAVTFRVVND
jgi:hypothetical protein